MKATTSHLKFIVNAAARDAAGLPVGEAAERLTAALTQHFDVHLKTDESLCGCSSCAGQAVEAVFVCAPVEEEQPVTALTIEKSRLRGLLVQTYGDYPASEAAAQYLGERLIKLPRPYTRADVVSALPGDEDLWTATIDAIVNGDFELRQGRAA